MVDSMARPVVGVVESAIYAAAARERPRSGTGGVEGAPVEAERAA